MKGYLRVRFGCMGRFLRSTAAWMVALCLVLVTACSTTSHQGSSPAPSPHGSGHGRSAPAESAGPQPADRDGIPTAEGTHSLDLDVGTIAPRQYKLHMPPPGAWKGWHTDGTPTHKVPLLLALHGGLSTSGAMEQLTGFDSLADHDGFMVAYPDGFMTTWNAGDCCGAAKWGNVDDVAFLTKLIDKLDSTGMVDPDRVYVTGFSNGAGMAYRMACQSSARIAAIGVVEGALVTPCDPARKVSVIIFHGTADPAVPYNGGGTRNAPTDNRPFPPVSSALDFWKSFDKLGAPKVSSHLTAQASSNATRCVSSGQGVEVVLCTIDGGGHQWSNTDLQWSFFAAHPAS
jgi:polyhydroxybutyrate depolymerase